SALGGQAELTPFRFTYLRRQGAGASALELSFSADPNVLPPTNVHVIIGRNSAGKTRLLRDVAATLCTAKNVVPPLGSGEIMFIVDSLDDVPQRFANLVTVTFSAFDRFEPPTRDAMTSGDIRYAYIG